MGSFIHFNSETGYGYIMDDKEVAEAGGMMFLGLGALAVLYFILFIIALAIISPFITLFVLDDIVDTFVANNASLFICIGLAVSILKLLPKFTDKRFVRIVFDTYIIIAVLYIALYVFHFDVLIYSFFKIIDNYLPADADRALLDVIEIDKLSAIVEGHWFYEFASDCIASFLAHIKQTFENVISIDNTSLQVPLAQMNILEVLKTCVSYIAVGGFGILSVLLFGILMMVTALIAIVLPYIFALAVTVICNKLVFRMHTASVYNRKKACLSKEKFAEYEEEFNFLAKGTSGYVSQKKVFDVAQELANEGNPYAQLRLAECYLHGEGTLSNDEKSFYWFQKAAFQGVTKAQFLVTFYYFNGVGTRKSRRLAKAWLNVAMNNKDYFARQKGKSDFMKTVAHIYKKTRYIDCL